MKYKIAARISQQSALINLSNKKTGFTRTLVFSNSHLNFDKIKQLVHDISNTDLFLNKGKITQKTFDVLTSLENTQTLLSTWSNGLLEVDFDTVTYKGKEIPQDLSDFLIKTFKADPHNTEALAAWSKYLELVEKADTYKTQSRLFTFLSHNDLQISPEGKVLAWKAVRVNGTNEDGSLKLVDIYTGTMNNSVGTVVTMDRSKVDDRDEHTCSTGLHIASLSYAYGFGSYGDALVQVEVDVQDIVSVPTDYNGQKARACRYEVKALVGIIGKDFNTKEEALDLAPIKGFDTATDVE